jgi:hypothetical protein
VGWGAVPVCSGGLGEGLPGALPGAVPGAVYRGGVGFDEAPLLGGISIVELDLVGGEGLTCTCESTEVVSEVDVLLVYVDKSTGLLLLDFEEYAAGVDVLVYTD